MQKENFTKFIEKRLKDFYEQGLLRFEEPEQLRALVTPEWYTWMEEGYALSPQQRAYILESIACVKRHLNP